ncbi:MAG TPA: hypothetical protein VH277_11690 [Gemmatimonadaceae bacterium]|jgi:hypothetical protein|nr:hypothetical protein [Gemmatimonadaceae bacterium]
MRSESDEARDSFADRGAEDQRLRGLRPPKPFVDPWKAHGTVIDTERRPDGTIERAMTVFLAGAECPFTCSFCDLWRFTIDGPTPEGALPKQIDEALAGIRPDKPDRIKLYNASNFFDQRAVPPSDLPRIAELCGSFRGVTVESHARTVGPGTLDFARRLLEHGGARLEVAMGLESIHPAAAARLNKRLDLRQFAEAADLLRRSDIDLRVFVLLGAPGVPRGASVEWAIKSVEYAMRQGASVVCIIPLRRGNGEMDRLASLGEFSSPTLADLERALDGCLGAPSTVSTVDLWDVDKLSACPACRASRIERLHRINLSGVAEPKPACSHAPVVQRLAMR